MGALDGPLKYVGGRLGGQNWPKTMFFTFLEKFLSFTQNFQKIWLLWTKIQSWIYFWVPICLGLHRALYKAPEDPELANLGVVVVPPEN